MPTIRLVINTSFYLKFSQCFYLRLILDVDQTISRQWCVYSGPGQFFSPCPIKKMTPSYTQPEVVNYGAVGIPPVRYRNTIFRNFMQIGIAVSCRCIGRKFSTRITVALYADSCLTESLWRSRISFNFALSRKNTLASPM